MLQTANWMKNILSIKQYKAATKKLGKLEYDECFGYVPLLALGGKESVSNLKKVKIFEHIALITEMTGEVYGVMALNKDTFTVYELISDSKSLFVIFI